MRINRKWAMPNKRTFQIKPIIELIYNHRQENSIHEWADPFPYPYKKDALDYLDDFDDKTIHGLLFDPPYSPRQLKECYDSRGETLTDTKSSVWAKWKDAIARKIKPGGICISFGWNTNGLGKKRGFEIIEILLVAHGGNHNDTIVTVEKKINHVVSDCNKEQVKYETNSWITIKQGKVKKKCNLCEKHSGVKFN